MIYKKKMIFLLSDGEETRYNDFLSIVGHSSTESIDSSISIYAWMDTRRLPSYAHGGIRVQRFLTF